MDLESNGTDDVIPATSQGRSLSSSPDYPGPRERFSECLNEPYCTPEPTSLSCPCTLTPLLVSQFVATPMYC